MECVKFRTPWCFETTLEIPKWSSNRCHQPLLSLKNRSINNLKNCSTRESFTSMSWTQQLSTWLRGSDRTAISSKTTSRFLLKRSLNSSVRKFLTTYLFQQSSSNPSLRLIGIFKTGWAKKLKPLFQNLSVILMRSIQKLIKRPSSKDFCSIWTKSDTFTSENIWTLLT